MFLAVNVAVFGPGIVAFSTNRQARSWPSRRGFQTPGIVATIQEWSGIDGSYNTPTSWEFAAFAQDDFKLTPRLTLNLGLRYDVSNLGFDTKADQALNPTYQVLKAGVGLACYGVAAALTQREEFRTAFGSRLGCRG